MSFLAELRRRNVIRVLIAYLAAAWFLVQIADTIVPAYGLPDSAVGFFAFDKFVLGPMRNAEIAEFPD